MRAEGIPQELQERPQWVLWRYGLIESGKWTKVPYQLSGSKAKSDSPSTWTTFDRVLEGYESGEWDGIGFVVTDGDPYVGIDIDHCLEQSPGGELILSPLAQDIVERLNSYTEITPSGEGLRVYVRGKLPEGRNKDSSLGLEAYETKRFFVVTGHRLDLAPAEIVDRDLTWLRDEYLGAESPPAVDVTAHSDEPLTEDDRRLIERAATVKNGEKFRTLWEGGWEGEDWGSHSEADLALCSILAYWTDDDPERIDRLFRHSGLMRPKWDERHGEHTYGEMTIGKALSGADDGVEGARKVALSLAERAKTDPGAAFEPDTLGALALLAQEDPAEWQRTRGNLRGKVNLRDLDAEVGKARRELEAQRRRASLHVVGAGDRDDTVGQHCPGAPVPNQPLRVGSYIVTNETVIRETEDGHVPVIATVVQLVQVNERLDDDGVSYRLAWLDRGRWVQRDVPGSVLFDHTKIRALADMGFPVDSLNAKVVVGYLAALRDRMELPRQRVAGRMGWAPGNMMTTHEIAGETSRWEKRWFGPRT
ncbi:hypothetical protein LIP_3572 [Limnochorda pilosa]|uniref:NrS-1 polymerase-like HBD domain-containing protein n=1 Tax=Limnochorda pilosa TaxID=1555112 RepID=A0A0K2SQH3_LIMPI|nr:hypothetical protein LIP_3572 [Limnochorda pilosa]